MNDGNQRIVRNGPAERNELAAMYFTQKRQKLDT
jgi:hypothetical protein